MSIKDKFKKSISPKSSKQLARTIWNVLVVQASVGCLILTLVLAASGGLLKGTESLLHIIANAAKLGPAPQGMINISKCVNAIPQAINSSLLKPLCQQHITEAIPIEKAAKASMQHSIPLILITYYLFGLLLGGSLLLFYKQSLYCVPKLCSFINKRKHAQFESDVNWCIEEMKQHFSGRPYWEESFTAYFTHGTNINESYWRTVNQTATKRITDIPTPLQHKEAYRELNRISFFSINVMAGSLLDCRHNSAIMKQALEEILTITHDQLSVRAPSSLSEHDHALQDIQTCIDRFCGAIKEPSADFIDFADKMNTIRLNSRQIKKNEYCIKQRNE